MMWLALYPFGGYTILWAFTGHTKRWELAFLALLWPLCWCVVGVVFAREGIRWALRSILL